MFGGKVGKENQHVKCRRRCRAKDVLVLGAVKTPGRYNLKQRDTLLTALAVAGGPTENADLLQAYVTRDANILPVNFKRLLGEGGVSQNILLKDKDFIYVPDISANKVFVLGEVRNPSVVPFREQIDIVEALARAGDFTDRASASRVYIVRGGLKQPQILQLNAEQTVLGKQKRFPLQRDDIVFVTRSALGSVNRFLALLSPSVQTALTAFTVQQFVK